MKRRVLAGILALFLALGAAPAKVRAAEAPNYSNYIIFARFANDVVDADVALQSQFADIKRTYENNAADGAADTSFKAYLRSISRGKLIVGNYFVQEDADGNIALLDLPMSFSEYAADTAAGDAQIIQAAIAYMQEHANLSVCAPNLHNGGQYLDNLTIIVQTAGAEGNEIITAHKDSYDGSESFQGYKVGDYNIMGSSSIVLSSGLNPSNLVHEFLHSVGLQDLYRQDRNGSPVGSWDIMADTPLYYPQYPLAYSRYALGYVPLTTVTQSGSYTIAAASSSEDPVALRLLTPFSEGEQFIVEYRRRQENTFENSISENGLLVYRVHTALESQSNYYGEDYIYVFRPNPSEPYDLDNLKLMDAALDPDKGESSFGSTDLSKAYNENTIYYADGQNSGIAISNIRYTDSGARISFDVAFADYEAAGLWPLAYAGSEAAPTEADICVDGYGNVYAAYASGSGSAAAVYVLRKEDAGWVRQGDAIAGASQADICAYGGTLYLSCMQGAYPCAYKLNAQGVWEQVYRDSASQYPSCIKLYSDADGIYIYHDRNSSTLLLYDLLNGRLISDSLSASYLVSPAVCRVNGVFYALFQDYTFGQSSHTQLQKLGTAGWESVSAYAGIQNSNHHALATDGTKLYALAGDSSSTYNFSVLAEDRLLQSDSPPCLANANASASLIWADGLYLGLVDSSSNKALVYSYDGETFEQLGGSVANNIMRLCIAKAGKVLYAALCGGESNSGLFIRLYAEKTDTVMPGDINGDKRISLADAVRCARIAVKLDTAGAAAYAAADYNEDGTVNVQDVILLCRYLVNAA